MELFGPNILYFQYLNLLLYRIMENMIGYAMDYSSIRLIEKKVNWINCNAIVMGITNINPSITNLKNILKILFSSIKK